MLHMTLRLFGLILLLLGSWVGPTFAYSFPSDPPLLDPKVYSSPSGRFVLCVDPSHKHGIGKASYRLVDKDRELWTGDKPFTLRDARVTDEGFVGGYAYSHGPSGGGDLGDVRVVILNTQGTAQLEEIIPRTTMINDSLVFPRVRGIFLDGVADRLIIRLIDREGDAHVERWRTYRLVPATPSTMIRPRPQRPTGLGNEDQIPEDWMIAQAHPVAGTRLILARWCDISHEEFSRFILIDASDEPVWSLDLPDGGKIVDEKRPASHFAVWSSGKRQRIEFSATAAKDGGWEVKELRRIASPQPKAPSTWIEPPARPVRELGRIELKSPEGLTRSRLGTIATLHVDHKGSIYAVDQGTAAVHVFDPAGRWLRTCSSSIADLKDEPRSMRITVSDTGDVYLNPYVLAAEWKGRYIHYSSDGKPLDVKKHVLDDVRQDWFCQPKSGNRWILGDDLIYLVNGTDAMLKVIDRCADRRWLGRPEGAAVAPDGSLAVIARDDVNLYTANGRPIRTFPYTNPEIEALLNRRIAYDGPRIAVADPHQFRLFDRQGTMTNRFSLKERGNFNSPWGVFFTSDGRELLLFDGDATIIRYELP